MQSARSAARSVAMKLNQIRAIVAIAERGSLRSAARQIGVTQPAITRLIQELEQELGAPLFERKATGMTLTPIGTAVVRRAGTVQTELDRIRSEVEQMKGNRVGTVAVGLSTVSHVALLPRVMAPFERRYPDVRLRIVEGLFPAIEYPLHDGVIDFYVGPLAGDQHPPELLVERLFDNRRLVFARRGHPLAGATSLAELTGAQWVADALTLVSGDELSGLFARHGLPAPDVAVSGQTTLSTLVTVANTDLLASLPQQWLPILDRLGLVVQVPVRETLAAATICMVRRAHLALTPVAQHLSDLFRRAAIHHARTLPGSPGIAA